jgi:hypothetical protein
MVRACWPSRKASPSWRTSPTSSQCIWRRPFSTAHASQRSSSYWNQRLDLIPRGRSNMRSPRNRCYRGTVPPIHPQITTPGGTRHGTGGRVYSDYQVCRKALNAPVAPARSGRRAAAEFAGRLGTVAHILAHTRHAVSQHPHTDTRAPTRVSVCLAPRTAGPSDAPVRKAPSLAVRGTT